MEYQIEANSSLGMNVPVTIYADETLIEKMMTDRTIKQAINVATLPGIPVSYTHLTLPTKA